MKPQVTLVLALAALLAAPVAKAGEQTDRYGVHRALHWSAPDGKTSLWGLYQVELGPSGMVSRVLAETPTEGLAMLTAGVDPETGISWTRFSTPDGDWTALLVVESGIRSSTLDGYFEAVERDLATGAPVKMRLVLDGDLSVEAEIGVDYPSIMNVEFLNALEAKGLLGQVVTAIPEDLGPDLLFLDRALSPSPLPVGGNANNIAHALRGPVEVLAGGLRRVEPDRGDSNEGWKMEVGPPRRGLEIDEPKLIELVGRFSALTALDPLRGGASDRRPR